MNPQDATPQFRSLYTTIKAALGTAIILVALVAGYLWYRGGVLSFGFDTIAVEIASVEIAADDATPAINTGVIFFTSDNTAPTAITDLDNATPGQMLWICIGGTGANASTIANGGNFSLSAAWNPGLDDCLQLFVQADNDYIEISRRNRAS